ncbi:MAG: T9SS type A sorting domain-containing protein [Bacteroidia bacterium]|nr:T9SS type A sorting domain-containing protein [Bacteroidia bacterium]
MAGHYLNGSDFGKFKLYKVDPSASVIFDNKYNVFASASCQPNPIGAISDGLSAIETTNGNDPYAVSGNVLDGCFFATFDASGIPQIKKYFPFPNSIGGSKPSQTTLIEVPFNLGGGYLITGSYISQINSTPTRLMYILRLDAIGNLAQSSSYHSVYLDPCHNIGYELKPSSIIVSPYTPNLNNQPEIVVVGEADALGSVECGGFVAHSEAFFMRIDFNSLNWISNKFYRHSTTSFIPEKNDFKSIIPTNFGSQNNYLIGGYSETSSNSTDRALMLMIDEIGSIQWSYIYNSSFSDTRACTQVIERISPNYDTTFYGSVISDNGGMLCFKVDGSGIPFASSLPVDNFNEFSYQSGVSGTPFNYYYTNNISFEPNPGSSEGIHLYGTAEMIQGNSDNWYMVKASFNGVSNGGNGFCNNSFVNNQLTTINGPNFILEHHVNQVEGPSECVNINIIPISDTPVPNLLCTNNGNIGAPHSNNKTTSITENVSTGITLFPNPTSGVLIIKNTSNSAFQNIQILDISGKIVFSKQVDAISEHELDISILKPGLYLIEIQGSDNKIIRKKLVKE